MLDKVGLETKIADYKLRHPEMSEKDIVSILSTQADDIRLSQSDKNSILSFDVPAENGWSIEKTIGVSAGILTATAIAADLVFTRGKNIKKFSSFIKTKAKGFSAKAKIPYRFKSKFHDKFHNTGDMLYVRKVQELRKKNLPIEKAVFKLYGKSTVEEIGMAAAKKDYADFVKQVDNYTAKIDKSFQSVIPSPIRHKYYRGFHGDNYGTKIMSEAKVGDVISPDLAYSHMSLKKSVAKDYSNLYIDRKVNAPDKQFVMEVIAPVGTRVSRNFGHLSEVVFQREAQFKVLAKEIKDGKTYIKLKHILPKNSV